MKAIALSLILSVAATFLTVRADDQQPIQAAGTNGTSQIQTNLDADVQALNHVTAKLNEAEAKLAAEKARLDAVNDDVMRQVKQAVDAAMAAAKANVADAGQTASTALANAGQIASAALANANAAAADAGGLWTLETQTTPRSKSSISHGLSRFGFGAAPAVIAIRPLNPQTRLDLQADLKIMDKLLQDKISRVAANDSQPVFTFNWSNWQMNEPAYIEDFGVLFNGQTSIVLASTETKPKHAAADGESDWDRAKKEVESDSGQPHFSQTQAGTFFRGGSFKTGDFSQERLEQLVKAIIQTLPEAKHIRDLKDGDAVVVTVAGVDDAGNPARLTVKTKKAEIDDLSNGKLKPEDFASRVVWSVN
jgi:hypothetical protein